MVFNGKRGVSALEISIIVFLVTLFIVIGIFYYRQFVTQAKEMVLQTELRNLRATIAFFCDRNKRFPESLSELEEKGYVQFSPESKVIRKSYLELLSRDSEGHPLDPFENRYLYDETTGKVHSQTEGYEDW